MLKHLPLANSQFHVNPEAFRQAINHADVAEILNRHGLEIRPHEVGGRVQEGQFLVKHAHGNEIAPEAAHALCEAIAKLTNPAGKPKP